MEQQESKAPGMAILIGITLAGSGIILVAGGLFGLLVVLLVAVGLALIAAGARELGARRQEANRDA